MALCLTQDNTTMAMSMMTNIHMDTINLSSQLNSLPSTWPNLFNLCHFILASLAVRKEVGIPFSRSNPLATWLATMSACFAGSLLANPLLGKPVLAAMASELSVFLATLSWWVVFYSPGDFGYRLAMNKVFFLPMCVLKQIRRAKKTLGGITEAGEVFPDQELLMVMVGVINGNGSGFMRPVTRLICGIWHPYSTELLDMSVTTKESLVAVVVLVADKAGYLAMYVSSGMIYLIIVTTFLTIKLAALIGFPVDPFQPLEKVGSWLAFGGLWSTETVRTRNKKLE